MQDGRDIIRGRNLLYTDLVGRDACGIGGVAAREGKPSHEVIAKSLLALVAMEHRGGVCGSSGDGAGLTCQLPQAFFREQALKLFGPGCGVKPDSMLAVGSLLLPRDRAQADKARAITSKIIAGGPITLLGWRTVPVNDDKIPSKESERRPLLEQVILLVDAKSPDIERELYRRRLKLRHEFTLAGIDAYIANLSSKLVNYKGLLTSNQFAEYFNDLLDPSFESGLSSFHRRYSTNTYPNWALAQPFHLLCHNGEINTLKTNRNAVHAYSRGLDPVLPGGELLSPNTSSSRRAGAFSVPSEPPSLPPLKASPMSGDRKPSMPSSTTVEPTAAWVHGMARPASFLPMAQRWLA